MHTASKHLNEMVMYQVPNLITQSIQQNLQQNKKGQSHSNFECGSFGLTGFHSLVSQLHNTKTFLRKIITPNPWRYCSNITKHSSIDDLINSLRIHFFPCFNFIPSSMEKISARRRLEDSKGGFIIAFLLCIFCFISICIFLHYWTT